MFQLKCVFVVVLFVVCVFASNTKINPEIYDEIDARYDHRIVGGADAADGAFPYQVSMRHENRHFCGGSIIDKFWILTAAHCVHNQKTDQMTIVVGTNQLSVGGVSYQVAKFIPHEVYLSSSISNDIALVKLAKPVEFNENVKPIELCDKSMNEGGKELVLSGWGTTSYPGKTPDKLKMIVLHSISDALCISAHLPRMVSTSNICTMNGEGEGACHGDSGGPLVHNGMQVGVVSWGIPCAKGKPDVFTEVYYYQRWIKMTMNETSDKLIDKIIPHKLIDKFIG